MNKNNNKSGADIGKRIKKRRVELGLTQEELANKCGYKSKSSINKIELSHSMPYKKVELIAIALECEPEFLMGWEDEEGYRKDLSSTFAIEDFRLISRFRKLNTDNQNIVMGLINNLIKAQEKYDK